MVACSDRAMSRTSSTDSDGREQRQGHPPEGGQRPGALEPGRLVDDVGQLPPGGQQDEEALAEGEGGHGDDREPGTQRVEQQRAGVEAQGAGGHAERPEDRVDDPEPDEGGGDVGRGDRHVGGDPAGGRQAFLAVQEEGETRGRRASRSGMASPAMISDERMASWKIGSRRIVRMFSSPANSGELRPS